MTDEPKGICTLYSRLFHSLEEDINGKTQKEMSEGESASTQRSRKERDGM